jgi:rod shape-determining protein MreD
MWPYVNLLILVVIVIAQTTVMSAASLGYTKPFLPLLAVVSWVLLRAPLAGAWWALALGLMLDMVSPSPSAFYTLPMMVVVLVAAVGRGRLFPSNLVIPWVLVAVATAAFIVTQRALIPLTGGTVDWSLSVLAREVMPEAALNLLWLPILYFPLRALARRTGGPRIEWER